MLCSKHYLVIVQAGKPTRITHTPVRETSVSCPIEDASWKPSGHHSTVATRGLRETLTPISLTSVRMIAVFNFFSLGYGYANVIYLRLRPPSHSFSIFSPFAFTQIGKNLQWNCCHNATFNPTRSLSESATLSFSKTLSTEKRTLPKPLCVWKKHYLGPLKTLDCPLQRQRNFRNFFSNKKSLYTKGTKYCARIWLTIWSLESLSGIFPLPHKNHLRILLNHIKFGL